MLENIDQNEDEEIGLVVLGSGEERPGDAVNTETINILEDRGFTLNVFEEPGSGEDEDSTAEEENAEGEAAEEDTAVEEDADAETAEEEMSPEEQRERDSARDLMISYMDEYGREIEVVMCSGDAQALGVMDAVNEEKRKVGHDVVILGFDCGPDSLREVAAGRIASTFFDNFLEQSKTASDLVLAMIRGDAVNSRNISEYVSVTVDNAQEILDISMSVQDEDSEEEETEEPEDAGDEEGAE